MANTDRALSMMRAFGKRLKAARIVAGYKTGKSFAIKLGMNDTAYRKYERGESLPPLDILAKISDLAKTSLDFLLLGR